MILFVRQKYRHRHREQTYGHQGRERGNELGDWDLHTYTINARYKIDNQFSKPGFSNT